MKHGAHVSRMLSIHEKDFHFSYELLSHWKELPIEDQVLVDRAFEAVETAYAKFCDFKVGASVRLDSDAIVTGSNQENAAYPSGLCVKSSTFSHRSIISKTDH